MSKVYKLNDDFTIECITNISSMGKSFGVRVIQTGLWFEPVLEEVTDIKSPEEANRVFKMFTSKYKTGL